MAKRTKEQKKALAESVMKVISVCTFFAVGGWLMITTDSVILAMLAGAVAVVPEIILNFVICNVIEQHEERKDSEKTKKRESSTGENVGHRDCVLACCNCGDSDYNLPWM